VVTKWHSRFNVACAGRKPGSKIQSGADNTKEGFFMTRLQFGKKIKAAMETGAASMPDGAQLIYHDDIYAYNRYFAVYDKYGNCVDTSYTPLNLYYLFW
jgi:hypothetical protein